MSGIHNILNTLRRMKAYQAGTQMVGDAFAAVYSTSVVLDGLSEAESLARTIEFFQARVDDLRNEEPAALDFLRERAQQFREAAEDADAPRHDCDTCPDRDDCPVGPNASNQGVPLN